MHIYYLTVYSGYCNPLTEFMKSYLFTETVNQGNDPKQTNFLQGPLDILVHCPIVAVLSIENHWSKSIL